MLEINENNFDESVKSGTVLLDFWAPWCGPCRMQSPILEDFSSSHPEVIVGKVNVDENELLAMKFGIMSIPCLVVYKNGEFYKKEIGLHSIDEIEDLIK